MNPTAPSLLPPDSLSRVAETEFAKLDNSWPGLATAAAHIGVPLSPVATERFDRYRDLLLDRGARFNLTAIKNPIEIERRLFLDALAMLPAITTFLDSPSRQRLGQARLIDVGSGAGFPGLALKIAMPDLQVTLLDATAKKVSFLNEVIATLGLDAIEAIHGRAEEFGRKVQFREQFEIGTARAVASLPVLLEFVMPFLEVGGQAFFPKGLHIDDELRMGRQAARTLSSEIVSAESISSGNTRLVIARKTTLTAKAYPRGTGIPNHSPLGKGA